MRFLIPTTSAPADPIASWLAAVARKTTVEARLVAVGDDAAAPTSGALASFLTPELVTRSGDATEGVLAEAAAYQPAFIALATRGLRGVVASVRRSLASSLIAEATIPLALFGPECHPAVTIERLILPLDGSFEEFFCCGNGPPCACGQICWAPNATDPPHCIPR
jgi:nucleotide-binding universal stress UspA family protein